MNYCGKKLRSQKTKQGRFKTRGYKRVRQFNCPYTNKLSNHFLKCKPRREHRSRGNRLRSSRSRYLYPQNQWRVPPWTPNAKRKKKRKRSAIAKRTRRNPALLVLWVTMTICMSYLGPMSRRTTKRNNQKSTLPLHYTHSCLTQNQIAVISSQFS